MKKSLPFVFFSLIYLSSFAQNEPYLVKKFNASQIENLEVKTSGGNISVIGGTGNEAVVEVYITYNGNKLEDKSEIKERLENYTLQIVQEGNNLLCFSKTNSNINWKKSLNISFKVYTPQNLNTDLITSGGGIKMVNLNGNLRFITSGGGLDLDKLAGDVKGRTSGGGIQISNSKDNIDVSTSGGGIDAENLSGNITLTTSGGGISLQNMNGLIKANTSGGGVNINKVNGELYTSTSGGSIRLSKISGSTKANTSGGSIQADFDKLGKFVILTSSSGNINVDIPMDKGLDMNVRGTHVSLNDVHNFKGIMEKDRISGSLNGGGIEVKIATSSGNVRIN